MIHPENDTASDDENDSQLRVAFQKTAFPPTPHLELLVLRRLRRRQLGRRGSFVGLVLVAAISVVVWQWRVNVNDRTTAGVQEQARDTQTLELAELQVLFGSPPVDGLDQLAQQQADYLAALDQAVKE
jgi:type VI protein secretion system component VasK